MVNQFSLGRLPVLLVVLLHAFILPLAVATENGSDEARKPNIVLIYADDVDCETVFGQFPKQDSATIQFPNLKAMAEQGVRFSNFHVTTPVCGPSRACLYTGQYAHRNQCRVNDPSLDISLGFTGGYRTFDPDDELANWMKSAGYRTAHIGKYLHSDFQPDYPNGIFWRHMVPSGWDHFRLTLGCKYVDFPCYVKSTDSIINDTHGEYRTDWDVRNAIDVIQKHADKKNEKRPLFLCWSPIAAHVTIEEQSMIAPRHESMYADEEIPDLQKRLSSKVENRISEFNLLPVPNDAKITRLTNIYRDRLRAIHCVDQGVGKLRQKLQNNGMLENTIFVFTSDHGFHITHNQHFGKRLPYDRITKVPFIVTGPGVPKDSQCDSLLANIDIAPTLVKLAGAQPLEQCDGESFSGLIFNPDQTPEFQRDGILIENWGKAVSLGTELPATYSSIRTHDEIYTEWATGGREFYDLAADPDQSVNLYPELDPEKQKQFAQQMRSLRKTDSPPKFTAMHCSSNNQYNRICGSLEPVVFSGFVESDAGTKSVELEIRSSKSDEYWNGDGWSATPFRLKADLRQAGGLISQWEFVLDTHQYARENLVGLSAREASLSVVATDLKGRETILQNEKNYSISFADPETAIDSIEYQRSAERLTATGTARGLQTVPFVRIGIQHSLTREYWNGTHWDKRFCQLDADVMPEDGGLVKWKIDIPLPETAQVIMIARAYNEHQSSDHTPAMEEHKLMNVKYQLPKEP